ncbi:phosphotransferase enzyme family protein [uncultured Friedmanniella sp.]|uniref:phosphotransferase enzyme family protein n=1 Tax=uncultured Friedmanniella sp. TaxID=335381 RepID=UPI0035C94DA6
MTAEPARTSSSSEPAAGHDRVTVDGDVVHRPAYPWTPSVHAVLAHLRARGLDCVPEPLGIADGVETLSFLDGEAGPACWPHQATERGLRSAARLLRRIHDASRGWTPPDAQWGIPPQPGAEVICHGDPGPWNMVWRDGEAVGIFDWDFAHPAPAMNDVAYALEYVTPFRGDQEALRWLGFTRPPRRARRMALFVEAYGGISSPLPQLVDAVIRHQVAVIQVDRDLAVRGIEPQRTWVADGHLETLQGHVDWSRAHREQLLADPPTRRG